ncbi:MAG: insulinase family protein [Blastocatellia bacterium]|nr:insulinase family protein [Blastocatellia bacterium]
MKEDIKETRLENGMVVLTDQMPSVRSVTLGFFLRAGSRNEPDELNGISHFIEHAVFKGTKRRTALDIAIEQDRLGGSLEAFTTHEETGFAIKVIDDQLEPAFDLLADMLSNPRFDAKEMLSEQRVIIEELKMSDDSPEDLLGEIFSRAFFPGHALGLNIAGTPKSVRTFDHTAAQKFHRKMFRPANIIVVAAGNVEHKKFVKLVNTSLFSKPRSRSTASSAISAFRKAGRLKAPKMAAPIILKQKRDLEQAHMLIATPFVSGRDKRRYAADLLSDILGGGMSSRLWQKIREERGLAYSVGASSIMFNDCGMFMVSAGTSPEQTLEVVDIVVQEMRAVVKDGVTAGELELAKQQTRASVLLSLEDSAARSASLAQSELLHGRQITLKESLANLDAVTLSDLHDLAREFFRTELIAFAALGNLKELKVGRKRLAI